MAWVRKANQYTCEKASHLNKFPISAFCHVIARSGESNAKRDPTSPGSLKLAKSFSHR
jgi:hypothetical protein